MTADPQILSAEEREGLRDSSLTYRNELTRAEHRNVAIGTRWAYHQKKHDILTEAFVQDLHKRLYGEVWTAAGRYRTTPRQTGPAPEAIPEEMRNVLDATRFWRDKKEDTADEDAVRLHHRLFAMQPFDTGCGPHARLMADLYVTQADKERFSWGANTYKDLNDLQTAYIEALQAGDVSNYAPLVTFARS